VLLLLGQQPPPGLEPLLAGYDVGKTHCLPPEARSLRRCDEPSARKWTVTADSASSQVLGIIYLVKIIRQRRRDRRQRAAGGQRVGQLTAS